MTAKFKPSRSHEAAKLAEEVSLLSDEDAFSLHGIEIYTDCVYDTIDDIEYDTLLEWAEAQIVAMYEPKFEKRHSHLSHEE